MENRKTRVNPKDIERNRKEAYEQAKELVSDYCLGLQLITSIMQTHSSDIIAFMATDEKFYDLVDRFNAFQRSDLRDADELRVNLSEFNID